MPRQLIKKSYTVEFLASLGDAEDLEGAELAVLLEESVGGCLSALITNSSEDLLEEEAAALECAKHNTDPTFFWPEGEKKPYDYICSHEADCVRISDGMRDPRQLVIDGSLLSDHTKYTEDCWDRWGEEKLTIEHAVEAARKFAAEILGRPGAAIYLHYGKDDWRLLPDTANRLPDDCPLGKVPVDVVAAKVGKEGQVAQDQESTNGWKLLREGDKSTLPVGSVWMTDGEIFWEAFLQYMPTDKGNIWWRVAPAPTASIAGARLLPVSDRPNMCVSTTERDAGTESVDHPKHYGGGDNPYEAIKVIEAWELGFNLGNTVKYISRAGKKDAAKTLDDLKKARWYLDRQIQNLEGK